MDHEKEALVSHMSHTPGPWEAIETPESSHQRFVVAAGRERIASLYLPGNADDASLIAASPDLLNALGRALFHATLRGWNTTEGHELADVYAQMKAAIAKAEGK